jgi:leucyl-tRNA---protein transferase
MNDIQPVRLYLSAEHACGYLSGYAARSAFVDPEWTLNGPRYQRLLEMGFRRSGGHVYRPHCRDCMRCVPVRVPVAQFRPSRSQRRCLQANADLQLTQTRTTASLSTTSSNARGCRCATGAFVSAAA